MLVHTYNIVIYRCIGEPVHGRYVFDGINATDKIFLSMLMTNVKLPGSTRYGTHIAIHTLTQKDNTILERE